MGGVGLLLLTACSSAAGETGETTGTPTTTTTSGSSDGTAATTAGSTADPSTSTGPTGTDPTSDPTDDSTAPTSSDPTTTTTDPTDPTDPTGEPCDDPCPAPGGGITWDCQRRFVYGVNYAWHHFAGDFGGIPQWGQAGVSDQPEVIAGELQAMRAAGVSVIRWWLFPDFRGAGVTFDDNDAPTGLGGTALADLATALDLAQEADVYLMPCLFSFDNFRPSQDVSGIWVPGIQPIVTDEAKRAALLEEVVRPLAAAVAAHPYGHRVIAWDVINEPEWAIVGPSPYGDMDYTPNGELQAISHAQMEAFVADTIAVLRDESDALITVGGAAMKWAKAWSQVDIDFYQFHIYDWVDAYWPYDMSPADFGVDDKPVVMGEFPIGGLGSADYGTMLAAWWELGYAGALGWQYVEASPEQLGAVKAFSEQHSCEVSF